MCTFRGRRKNCTIQISYNLVQSGDGAKNVHFKFDKYKNNTLIFYKTATRYAW